MLAWRWLNRAMGERNRLAIDACDVLMAVLDGVDVDSGTAAEVGYAFARGKLIMGYRGDFRLSSDNEGAAVNLQVEHFILGERRRHRRLHQCAFCHDQSAGCSSVVLTSPQAGRAPHRRPGLREQYADARPERSRELQRVQACHRITSRGRMIAADRDGYFISPPPRSSHRTEWLHSARPTGSSVPPIVDGRVSWLLLSSHCALRSKNVRSRPRHHRVTKQLAVPVMAGRAAAGARSGPVFCSRTASGRTPH